MKVSIPTPVSINIPLPSDTQAASMDDIDTAEKILDDVGEVNSENLMVALKAQREAINTAPQVDTETAISNSLLEGINNSALELEILNGWTEGGKAMFSSIISGISDNILKDGKVEGIELEDMLQLVLLEAMVNQDKYGLTEYFKKPDVKESVEHLLESIGSASHGLHESPWDKEETLAQAAVYVLKVMLEQHTPPAGSLLEKLITAAGFNKKDGIVELYRQIKDKYHDKEGWLIYNNSKESGSQAATKVSPLIAMMITSDILNKKPDITKEQMNKLLSQNINEIESVMRDVFSDNVNYQSIYQWIEKTNEKWQIQDDGHNDTGGHGGQLDWVGNGLSINDLVNIYDNFPSRVLSDEDIKDINRIGDNVKMIMQTLKYWFQILRDERVAIARNI
ncbi:molecular chaperone [Grimontia hollisae]|uniref:molecular chaperone n=1 Tax=Grimontia hollisae TaxID=673 RepID=UPI0023D98439|nr:molecular chaperone [Grimontia hollisae]MDF2185982.1 molecular chaperone [Grimontia hollisae]